MPFDFVYVNVRYSFQDNSKVGRKSFDSFRSPQANCDKYFLKLHFLNESFGHFHQTLSATKKSRLFYLKLFQT